MNKSLFNSIFALSRNLEEREVLGPFVEWLATSTGAQLEFASFAPKGHLIQLIAEKRAELVIVCKPQLGNERTEAMDPELLGLIESTSAPVLIVPRTREESGRYWRSILVPMSGEVRKNEALELAIRLANALTLPVDVVHVVDPSEPMPAIIARFSDDAHHELPKMVDEFLAEASPLTSVEEKSCLRDFRILRGAKADEVIGRAKREKNELIALQWKGTFMSGHATILKAILRETSNAMLLVKQQPAASFRLKAGANLGGSGHAA